jgi:hypothetical protein
MKIGINILEMLIDMEFRTDIRNVYIDIEFSYRFGTCISSAGT